jgi:FMN phosphatase YigB (HAD superfamily)
MIRTVLLDLDDTLLANSMDSFLPAYFQALGSHLAGIVDEGGMLKELIAGTQDMLANLDPCITLEQAFSRRFFPALGLNETEAKPVIEAFYRGPYQDLKSLTSTIQGARSLLMDFRSRGLELVIATNPLFPRVAVEERLAWADLAADGMEYSLIASYENLHFAKPQPEYFAEILARLGRQPGEALMIGDSLKNEILPAHRLGMAVFHVVTPPGSSIPSGDTDGIPPVLLEQPQDTSNFPSGSLQDFKLELLESPNIPGADPLQDPRIILARLRAVPAAVRVMTASLAADTWNQRPEGGEWAPAEIMCHLRDVELEVNLPRLAALLEQANPHLPAFDTDRWAGERDYLHQDGGMARDDFCQARIQLISILAEIEPQDWERSGRHSLLGPTTIRELMKITSEHDWLHLAQLRQAIATLAVHSGQMLTS